MRSPSSKVLKNRCDIYVSSPARDNDGGVQFAYTSSPQFASTPCTAQPQTYEEVEDQGRITQRVGWLLIFGSYLGLSPKDKILLMDAGGVLHTMFVEASRDNAGRDAAYSVRAEERV